MDRTVYSGPYCNVLTRNRYMLITEFARFRQFQCWRGKHHLAFPIR